MRARLHAARLRSARLRAAQLNRRSDTASGRALLSPNNAAVLWVPAPRLTMAPALHASRHELPALMVRMQVPLPRAVWFAKAVLSSQRVPPAAPQPPAVQPPHPRHAATAASASVLQPPLQGPAQAWTSALLALLSQLASALGAADPVAAGSTAAGVATAAAAVATPPQPPPPPPATEQAGYRGAAACAGAPENPAAAAASGAPASSAEHAAARLVDSAAGDSARLRVLWSHALRLGAYSMGAGLGDPAVALEWCLAQLGAGNNLPGAMLQLARPQQPGAAAAAGQAPAPGLRVPLLQEAALQLALACVEGVATSSAAVARLMEACIAAAERAGASSQATADGAGSGIAAAVAAAAPPAAGQALGDERRLVALAVDVLRALVLLAPGALPGLEGLPRLARLLEGHEAAAGPISGGGLLRLARASVAAAQAEVAALTRSVSPRWALDFWGGGPLAPAGAYEAVLCISGAS
jgi:hypothetical protein